MAGRIGSVQKAAGPESTHGARQGSANDDAKSMNSMRVPSWSAFKSGEETANGEPRRSIIHNLSVQ
jgi:hypothetical protein